MPAFQWWLVPLLLILAMLPMTPPPAKDAQAQQPPIFKPADPFDDINLMTPQRMRGEAERAIPRLKAVRGY